MSLVSWTPAWVDSSWTRSVQLSSLDDPLHRLGAPVSSWECVQLNDSDWPRLAEGLVAAGDSLKTKPIRRIVEVIEAATEPFRDPDSCERRESVEAIRAATGLSNATIQRSLDLQLANYRAAELWSALRRDFRDPRVLDEFRSDKDLRGLSRAIGPRLTVAIATGNVPGLPLLPLVRALLVKSPILLKVARGEPTFAGHFMRSLNAVDSEIAQAVAVTYWDARNRDAFAGAMAKADCVVVFGGDTAVEAIHDYLRPGQRVMVHGHKFSAGIVTEEYLEQLGARDVAEHLVFDICAFDQHACIAPKVLVVQGEDSDVDGLGEHLARALADYAEAFPPGDRSPFDATSLAVRKLAATWAQANGTSRIWDGPGLSYTIVRCDDMPDVYCGGDRYIVLVPARTLQDCVDRLECYSTRLQNVVVGATDAELPKLAESLARIGACRVSPPGMGANPTLLWRHDGHACLAELVRWCDIEGLHTGPGWST